MRNIQYTVHLELRIKLRKMPYDLPKKIYQTANERYFDDETKNFIAIKNVKYKNKMREMALIYQETFNEVILITIHPLKLYQKISRINSGRWMKI